MLQLCQIMLGSLLRMVLLGIFAALIERGVWSKDQVEQIAIGLGGFFITAIWALWNHYKTRIKFLTALESPAGTSEEHVILKMKEGKGATL